MSDESSMMFGVDTSAALIALEKLELSLKSTLSTLDKGAKVTTSELRSTTKETVASLNKLTAALTKSITRTRVSNRTLESYKNKITALVGPLTAAAAALDVFSARQATLQGLMAQPFGKGTNTAKMGMETLSVLNQQTAAMQDQIVKQKTTEDAGKRIEQAKAKRGKRQLQLAMAYDKQELQSKYATQLAIKSLYDAGYSSSRIAREYGLRALGDYRNLDQLQQKLEAINKLQGGAARRAATNQSLTGKNYAYSSSPIDAKIKELTRVQAAMDSKRFSTPYIARQHGTNALRDVGNLPNMLKEQEMRNQTARIESNLNKAAAVEQTRVAKEAAKIQQQSNSHVGKSSLVRDANNRVIARGTKELDKNRKAMLAGNRAMHDARGLSRGLSGSLGQLWMTYGSIAPLIAGAAVGNIARQTFSVGKDVEYRLKMMEALGNEAVKVEDIMSAVHGSMKTPLEAAEGMQELGQAGLNTTEALIALGTTLQLATLGEMSVGEAALTTTAAISTFSLSIEKASSVGDTFAKGASISNTSVKGIAEAMKQAGAGAAAYGVTLEETVAQIAILAQNGIRGSAAGTAIKNSMKEIYAPTKKAEEVMKKLNLEVYNADGTAKNYMEVLKDLNRTYVTLDEESQNKMLGAMFNERSRRAIQIYLKDLGALEVAHGRLVNSSGFLSDANDKLLDTVEGASNRMSSILQQAYVDGFDKIKPQIRSTIENLEKMFASEGFMSAVTKMGTAISALTSILANHANTIVKLGAVYLGAKAAIGSFGIITSTMAMAGGSDTEKEAKRIGKITNNMRNLALANGLATTSSMALTAAVVGSGHGIQKAAEPTRTLANNISRLGQAAVPTSNFIDSLGKTTGNSATGLFKAANGTTTFTSAITGMGRGVGIALGVVSRFMPIINLATLALTLGTAAWYAFGGGAESSKTGLQTAMDKVSEGTARIVTQNEQLRENIRLQALALGQKPVDQYSTDRKNMEELTTSKTDLMQQQKQKRLDIAKGEEQYSEIVEKQLFGRATYVARSQAEKVLDEKKALYDIQEQIIKVDEALFSRHLAANEATGLAADKLQSDQRAEVSARLDTYVRQLPYLDEKSPLYKVYKEAERAQTEINKIDSNIREGQEAVKRIEKAASEAASSMDFGGGGGGSGNSLANRLKRQLESYDEWLAKQKEKVVAQETMTEAYLKGENAVASANTTLKIEEQLIQSGIQHRKSVTAVMEAMERVEARNDIAKKIFEMGMQNDAAEKYLHVLEAQSVGAEEGRKALHEYNKQLAITEALAGRSAEGLEDLIDRMEKDFDKTNVLGRQTEAQKELNGLVESTKNTQEKYNDELERLVALEPYARTAEQASALQLAINNLKVENDTFSKALYEGFQELDKGAGQMWENFFENGKFTMESTSKMFNQMLARMAHEALTKPLMISIQNAVLGTNTAGGIGSGGGILGLLSGAAGKGGGGGGGGVGGLLGAGQNISSIYSSVTGGLTKSLAGGIGKVGEMLGSTALKSLSMGMASTVTGSLAGVGAAGGAGLGGMVGTGAIANTAFGATIGGGGAMAGAGAALGAAMPWIAGGLAVAGLAKSFMNKGETRSGGGFGLNQHDKNAYYGGGPSGGHGGQNTISAMTKLLTGQREAIQSVIEGAKIQNVAVAHVAASFESSDKNRGGTSSGGILNIDGHEITFGTKNKGEGYGGKSGSVEEMFENMEKDLAYSALEAFKQMGSKLPNILQDVFRDVDIRALSPEEAAQAVAGIQQVVGEVNLAILALDKLPFKNLTGLTFDLSASLLKAAGGIDNLLGGLDSFYNNFYTEAERGEQATQLLKEAIQALGFELPATRSEFRALVDSINAVDEVNHKALAGFYGLSDAANDYYNRLEDSLDDYEKVGDALVWVGKKMGDLSDSILGTFQDIANRVQRLFSARSSGRTLTDAIGKQLNKRPHYAGIREQEIKSAMESANWEQQIELAEELHGLINARYDLEKEKNQDLVNTLKEQLDSISKMRDLSISLRDYIQSLQTSDLSPNTLRQKVSIAETELTELVTKARGGDEDSMGKVQNSLEQALRLWRDYGASGSDYQSAYYRLTSLAEGLALDNLTTLGSEVESLERQISILEETKGISSEQLSELEALFEITDKATQNVSKMYDQAFASLEYEAWLLEQIGMSAENLTDIKGILGNLPTEIAVALSPIMERMTNGIVEGWYEEAFGTRADKGGLDYWTDRVQNEGFTQPKKEFDRIVNEDHHMRKEISSWYASQLGRNPDREGLEFWVDHALEHGYDRTYEQFMKVVNGSHRDGLGYVPFDGYVAELHKGERVLTAHENSIYNRSGNSSDPILAELRELRREMAQNTSATVEVGNYQIQATNRAAEYSSQAIVTGVGTSIRERTRDDTIRSNSVRRGIL